MKGCKQRFAACIADIDTTGAGHACIASCDTEKPALIGPAATRLPPSKNGMGEQRHIPR
ncbi:hypothetical protein [Cupriavidus malaysiensis]|uniref:hypothetical protein n=1 Tax=Cupriavidus malaysiensis TaxID=367825 RepID=UPI0012FF747A|nr:hypothetical protein [Cupriavidus malaysiensis]